MQNSPTSIRHVDSVNQSLTRSNRTNQAYELFHMLTLCCVFVCEGRFPNFDIEIIFLHSCVAEDTCSAGPVVENFHLLFDLSLTARKNN